MNSLILLIIGGTVVTFGDIFLKKWAISYAPIISLRFLIGILISSIGLTFLAFAFRSKSIATANIIFVAVNTIAIIIIQMLYFKEKITLIQLIGIIIAAAGVILIEFGSKK